MVLIRLQRLSYCIAIFLTAQTFFISSPCSAATRSEPSQPPDHVQFSIVVVDSNKGEPLELARIILRQGGRLIAGKVTNGLGRAIFRDLESGYYIVQVRNIGFIDYNDSILVDRTHTFDSIVLRQATQEDVVVSGSRESNINTVDINTGNQVFESQTYHAPPQARATTLIQQNVAGAARAPTGEVHIRGQHGEFTYYIDGAPIPLGVFGGLNEIIDPRVIERLTFLTGGFPAEYGGQIAAVIELQNRVPSGGFHFDLSTYGGTYATANKDVFGAQRFLNSNGQGLAFSNHIGPFGFYISGSRQETDRRIDPPLSQLFHDHGLDYFLYGKFDYILSPEDYLTSNLSFGRTVTQIPFDSTGVVAQDDNQVTTDAYQTLSYYRSISSEVDHEKNLLVNLYAREGGLLYDPGSIDAPTFRFPPDSIRYNVSQDRRFSTFGLRTKYDQQLSHEFQYSIGATASTTHGTANFASFDSLNRTGPFSTTPFTGYDLGAFVETQYHPVEWTQFDIGIRYDRHSAPDVNPESALEPRIKWNVFLDPFTTAYLYYGKLFVPTNIEGLHSIAANVAQNINLVPTVAERDDLYEAVLVHSFDFGLTSKLAGFYKLSSPGVDDQTIGSSSIKTPVNIAQVRVTGLELALTYSNSNSPFSGYLNAALTHAYGSGIITGGFLPFATDGTATDLDHDQRLSVSGSLNYQPNNWFANVVAIYGSGITNGNPGGLPYGSGLFDFNQFAHVTPSWIFNLGAGYTFNLAGSGSITPSIFISNILDNQHLLKGSYFSAKSWDEPRNIVLKVAYHL